MKETTLSTLCWLAVMLQVCLDSHAADVPKSFVQIVQIKAAGIMLQVLQLGDLNQSSLQP